MLVLQPRYHVGYDPGEDVPAGMLREFLQGSRVVNLFEVLKYISLLLLYISFPTRACNSINCVTFKTMAGGFAEGSF